jgi:valyl-tRNA synthetase
MVCDKNGAKMSKARGNVIDPLEVINGCSLEDLLIKIDQGNLPAKEVCMNASLDIWSVRSFNSSRIVLTWG